MDERSKCRNLVRRKSCYYARFFYQKLIGRFDDVKGFSATDHEFFRKSFYNQIAPREYLLEEKEYELIGKIFGLDLQDFCNLSENFSRFCNQDND